MIPATNVPAKQTNTNAFASAGALAPTARQGSALAPGADTVGIPYLAFANQKMNSWNDIKTDVPTLKEGDAVIKLKDQYVKLEPLVFSVVELSRQMWVNRGDDNKPTKVTFQRQEMGNPSGLVEEFQAVLLVYTPTGIVPAKASFRMGIAPLGEVSDKGLNQSADTAKWAAISNDHAVTTKGIPDQLSNLRFTVVASTFMHPTKKGRKMVKAKGKIAPLTSGQIKQLADFISEPSNMNAINRIRDIFKKNVEELTSLAG